jgi:ribosome maturation factor RimP
MSFCWPRLIGGWRFEGGPLAHFFVSAAGFGQAIVRENAVIERLIGPSLDGMGFRLIRVSFGGGGRPVLQIMAEPSDGSAMSVEHCAEISRAVSAILDVEDPIPDAYMLEVTSPGIDRPLVSRDDYRRFAGFEARLEVTRAVEGRKRFRGIVQAVDEQDCVTIIEEAGRFAVPFGDIIKAKLILTDALLAASQTAELPPDDDESAA